jgi:hypothetical protein
MCRKIDDLRANNYQKNKIKSIAEKHNITKSALKKYYNIIFFKNIAKNINLDVLSNSSIKNIEELIENTKNGNLINEFKFIKTDLQKIISKSLYVAMSNGFSNNLNHIHSGIMTANAGDSAEFIFIARAILAGFNCSSVDVRSSRYDAIVDFNGKLLRVQVKGISSGNNISFKDRDRGGQGIDHTHERNLGKRITSKDCDVYVAVDKQVGICYIIPMSWSDQLTDEEAKTVKLTEVLEYKENWDIIKKIVDGDI